MRATSRIVDTPVYGVYAATRTFSCRVCGCEVTTRSKTGKRCPACSKEKRNRKAREKSAKKRSQEGPKPRKRTARRHNKFFDKAREEVQLLEKLFGGSTA